MNKHILNAIEYMCNLIENSYSEDRDDKRADVILKLALSGLLLPKTEEETEEEEGNDNSENEPFIKNVTFEYNGIDFVALGEEQGGILAVVKKCLDEDMEYDNKGQNNWINSSLRKFLNEEYINNFDKADLLPFVSDLTSDDGMSDYGSSEDYIALLSDNHYRKYRNYIPKYNNRVWTITPWSCKAGSNYRARIIAAHGALLTNNTNNAIGVAPACIFRTAYILNKLECEPKIQIF